MINYIRKSIIFIVILSLFISCSSLSVYANDYEREQQYRYVFIRDCSASIAISSSGTITYGAILNCHDNTSSCNVTAYLEKRPIGSSSSWSVVCSSYGSGSKSCETIDTATAVHGYEYHVRAKCNAYGSVSPYHEDTTAYSVVKSY